MAGVVRHVRRVRRRWRILNARINASRIDRRIHKGNWCNPSGAGIGERPRAAPATGIDAYVWIKPPGESDGSSSLIPNDEGKGFDRMCDPTYTRQSAQQQQLDWSAAERAAVGTLVPGAVPAVVAERLPAALRRVGLRRAVQRPSQLNRTPWRVADVRKGFVASATRLSAAVPHREPPALIPSRNYSYTHPVF